jgi:hypothetical protein
LNQNTQEKREKIVLRNECGRKELKGGKSFLPIFSRFGTLYGSLWYLISTLYPIASLSGVFEAFGVLTVVQPSFLFLYALNQASQA